jgi:amidase
LLRRFPDVTRYRPEIAPHGNRAVATAVGLPATIAAVGHSEHGLPVGVQIIGGYLDDRTTIAFAGMVEHAFGGFVPQSSFAG